jgi:hypothetical protein
MADEVRGAVGIGDAAMEQATGMAIFEAYGPPVQRVNPGFPGVVKREDLVKFCQEYVKEVGSQIDSALLACDTPGMDDESKDALMQQYSRLIGQQLAMRTVCEWAKRNVV